MWKRVRVVDDRRMQRSRTILMCLAVLAVGAGPLAAQAAASTPPPVSPTFPKRIFYRQFQLPLKPHTWTLYNGRPGCCPQSYWAPSHVVSKGGMLRIQTYKDPNYGGRWVSGGTSMARLVSQTYGRWVIRFRMKRAKGVGMDVALRPNGSGTVLDWAEESSDKGAARRVETATLHYGGTRVHAHVTADFTKWHRMTVQWVPGDMTVRLDGHIWAHYTSHVPSSPMHMVMQTNVGSNGFTGVMPDSTTPSKVALQVDYVAVYRYH
jgi:hypothetical protein